MNLKFGATLKKLRRDRDMTQDELAGELGLSVQSISRYETESAYPDIEMLPVIAGYFGVTVDSLLGVSDSEREKRYNEYVRKSESETDNNKRYEILRQWRAEFPGDNMAAVRTVKLLGEMPGKLAERRSFTESALKTCTDMRWRDEIMFHYLNGEPDEETALRFIAKYGSHLDRRISSLMENYYWSKDNDKALFLKQWNIVDKLWYALNSLTEFKHGGMSVEQAAENCEMVLDFIGKLSNTTDLTSPDMWISTKLLLILRLANNRFSLGDKKRGYEVLNTAVTLVENMMKLPKKTSLTWGNPKFNRLNASTQTRAHIDFNIGRNCDFSGYMGQIFWFDNALYSKEKVEQNPELFSGYTMMAFGAGSALNPVIKATWAGFSRVANEPEYRALAERLYNAISFSNPENIRRLLVDETRLRVCAFYVDNVGAVFLKDVNHADSEDKDWYRAPLKKAIEKLKADGTTKVTAIAASDGQGHIIPPPKGLLDALYELNEDNIKAEIIK